MKPIVVLGAGGYAQEVVWIIESINEVKPTWEILGYIDPGASERRGQTHYDHPVLGGFEMASSLPANLSFACGIGKPRFRRKESQAAEALGWQPVSLVHPSVITARHVQILPGAVIGAGSILAPYSRVGRHSAVNLHVTVGHDAAVGDYCVLSPGCRISGNAQLEDDVFIGTNATVYVGCRLGAGGSLGANSFLVSNLQPGRSAFGSPAVEFPAKSGGGA